MIGFFCIHYQMCYNKPMIKFSEEIKHALKVMGYNELMPIQEKVIPKLLNDRDIIVKAKTGSGKTAAFAIPLCEQIDWNINEPQAIVLACTRELAMQIQQEISNIGKFKKIKAALVIGKENMDYQRAALKQKCHIVVATPGRLYDHILQENIDLSKVKYVIIDEADYMLDMGFCEQVEQILKQLPQQHITALFSATYPEKVQSLIQNYTQNAEWVEIEDAADIAHYYIETENRWHTLLYLLTDIRIDSAIIFCNQQEDVDKIYRSFQKYDIDVLRIHGGMLQKQRISNMEAFKKGKSRLLIASDVAARGIDVEKVSHIIHYDMPKSSKEYTHRCGRSGRINQNGISILLVNNEKMLTDLQKLYTIQKLTIHESGKYKLSYLNEAVNKTNKSSQWAEDVCKLYFSVGKSKKIRTIDIVGSLCSIEGITQADIGVINVLNHMSYVEILNGKQQLIIEAFQHKTIKNKQVKVAIANE